MSRRLLTVCLLLLAAPLGAEESAVTRHWVWTRPHLIPEKYTSEQSGYFSLIEGQKGKIYVGAAKYGSNAYLVEFNPATGQMTQAVDCQAEIGTKAKGFAAQAKIHTRNNIGPSGKIYFGTKQGYPLEGEKRTDYLGGYPMVFDPATGQTKVYPIPVPHQGIISVTPDESRGVAYISTCSDERPVESTHFMVLNLETGQYRDLLDAEHMYAFIVVDYLGRAYHPVRGGTIARFDPRTDKLETLKQTIDGQPPTETSFLAVPDSHPINWDISPDLKTLYAVALSGNQLYSYDLTAGGDTLPGKSLGALIKGTDKTDCRAMCVGPDGTVWAGVGATFPGQSELLFLVSYTPGSAAPVNHGPIAFSDPDFTTFTDAGGKPKPWHHGTVTLRDGTRHPRFVIMGICAARDGRVYLTTLAPFTLHEIRIPRIAGVTTVYRRNTHADMLLGRLLETDWLNGLGSQVPLKLSSMYVDQVGKGDISRELAKQHHVAVADTVAAALTVNGKELNVDGVILVAEHGEYPKAKNGQEGYPKRRLFEEVFAEFERSGKSAPVFTDKHLSDNWQDAKWIYDTAQKLRVPLMAGSSLPSAWRVPAVDLPRGAKVDQIVGVFYGGLDAYGFHALEMIQCLVERRGTGETGVASVQTLTGPAVWEAGKQGVYDRKLLDATLAALKYPRLKPGKTLEESVKEPVLFVIRYRDGLQACAFQLNGAVAEFACAWREAGGEPQAVVFELQEDRPYNHFTYLLLGIEKLMQTGQPAWPVERTLLTTGILDAAFISRNNRGQLLETPWLDVKYQCPAWNWQQPPAPPVLGKP